MPTRFLLSISAFLTCSFNVCAVQPPGRISKWIAVQRDGCSCSCPEPAEPRAGELRVSSCCSRSMSWIFLLSRWALGKLNAVQRHAGAGSKKIRDRALAISRAGNTVTGDPENARLLQPSFFVTSSLRFYTGDNPYPHRKNVPASWTAVRESAQS